MTRDELIKSCSRRTANAADLYAFLEKDDEKGKRAVNAALIALKREGAMRVLTEHRMPISIGSLVADGGW